MDIGFLISFFVKVYAGFTSPRNMEMQRRAHNVVVRYHKLSTQEFKITAPLILFLTFCFLVIPLAKAHDIKADLFSDLKGPGEIVFGAAMISWLFGCFYLCYRVTMRLLLGIITLTFSSVALTVDQSVVGVRRIDVLRIPKDLIIGAEIVAGFSSFWCPVLALRHAGGQLTIMRQRSEEDMLLVKRMIDRYASSGDPLQR